MRKGSGMKRIVGMFSVWLVLALSAHAASFDNPSGKANSKDRAWVSNVRPDPRVSAAEKNNNGSASGLNNIGFVKNPPKALTEKFPMCDAFLNVKWIAPEKNIGYTHFEAIIKNKYGRFKGRKMVWALVDLDALTIDYDVYQYKRKGRLQEVFNAVRNGKVEIGIPMMITYKGKTIVLYSGGTVNYDATQPLLSDHRQTVCVPYPDGRRAWVFEGKNVAQTYDKKQFVDLTKKVDEADGDEVPRERIKALWLLDINHDGKNDFVFVQSFFYSMQDRLYAMGRTSKYPNFEFDFPPSNRTCSLKMAIGYPLVTDGKNYYFHTPSNECNLTELTSLSGEE